ncbi:MAG: hypothetical protein KDA84_11220, partial [Planctomycetaceae bacterium]|nr:hypothetical protein [Planctomycetaceae bacterium]
MMIFPRVLKSLVFLGLCCGVIGSPTLLPAQDPLFQLEPPVRIPGLDGFDEPEGPLFEVTPQPTKGTAADLKPGDEVKLSITVNVPSNSYTYSQTTPKGSPTKITISKMSGLEAVGEKFEPARKPKKVFVPEFEGDVEKFEKPITWTRQYRLTKGSTPADVSIAGKAHIQLCDDSTCRFANETFTLALVQKSAAAGIVQTERPTLNKKPGPAEITATLAPKEAKPGDKVTLTIQMKLDDDWHTYSITQKKAIGAQATKIEVEQLVNLEPLGDGFQSSEEFEEKDVDVGISVVRHEVHHGTISWSRQYEVTSDAKQDNFGVTGKLNYQICDANRCVPSSFSFSLNADSTAVAQEPTSEPETDIAPVLSSREERLKALLGESVEKTDADPTEKTDDTQPKEGFWLFIGTAIVAGFF